MLELWNKGRELRALRAVDAASALLVVGIGEAGMAVLQRLLATVFECGAGGTSAAVELSRAGDALIGLPLDTPQPEAAARAWLAEAHRQRALERAQETGVDPDQAQEELLKHHAWALHQLDPLARRIRLVHASTGRTAAEVSRAARLEGHLLARWSRGATRPDAGQRRALARALGLAPGWLGVQRDTVPDTVLYQSDGSCPCGVGAARFAAGTLDERPLNAAWGKLGLFCTGCGQPYLVEPDGRFHPVPGIGTGRYAHQFGAIADGVQPDGWLGAELSRPWPLAHWYSPDGLNRRGVLQIPEIYRSPPAAG
ncbi:transcriptional regulator [Streptomyces sp. NRRL B-24484]|uniref:transcriptional regulator n=1 Tax=Streptomyces sp. NRRL B-24484 TaxID=1463833 RepID=UPI0004C0ED30|nr:transcriptional regulator [Streptomyces sp. NRRL B-24484]